jgi:hypothetical protein
MYRNTGPLAHIGLIDVLGKRLYSGQITWLREYLQNSIDGGAKQVKVSLLGNDLEISDDGLGMDGDTLSRQAFSIGKHFKGPKEIGELGVGIYAGSGMCARIRVRTRAKGKGVFEATLDMVKFREITASQQDISFEDGMKEIFTVREVPSDEESAPDSGTYTSIRFENIGRDTLALLKTENIATFVERTVNLPIDERFPSKKELEKFLGEDRYGIRVALEIDSSASSLKKFSPRDVQLASTFWSKVISDAGGRPLAKVWACYNSAGRSMPDARILVKQRGLTVGDQTCVESRFHAKYSPRFYGEIVVLDERIEINTSRDWFVDSPALSVFVEGTRAALNELYGVANFDSTRGVALVHLIEARNRARKAQLDGKKKGNWGVVSDKGAVVATLDHKIQGKIEGLKAFKKEADKGRLDTSSPSERLKLELAKRTLQNPIVRAFAAGPFSAQGGPQKERNSPLPQIVRTFLTEKVIDSGLSSRIGTRGDIKDTTDRAFTFVEQRLKSKVGRKEHDHTDWKVLVSEFKSKYRPNDLKGARLEDYLKAFDGIMDGFHVILRNPSNHSFLDDMNDRRSIMQVILISDFLVHWLDQWVPKSTLS